MKLKSVIYLMILIIISCGEKQTDSKKDVSELSIANFDWLIGRWQRTNEGAGKETFEQWNKNSESEYVGMGCTLQGVDTIFKEDIQLIKSKNEWQFVVLQKNASSPTIFSLSKMDANSFICENAENDFPKKIQYTSSGDKMIAIISGGGKEIPFEFERISGK